MSAASKVAVPKGGAAGTKSAQPRENKTQTAIGIDSLKEKTFFLIREQGGKRHEVKGRLMKIHIAPGVGGGVSYIELTYLAGGIWTQVLTTPFDFDIATCERDGA